jgi:hypothetical protein
MREGLERTGGLTVLAVACIVACAEVKGLAAIGGPFGFIVEGCGVPHNLRCVRLCEKEKMRSHLLRASAAGS